MSYEYKVVPSPSRGEKAKGLKGPEQRFAHTLQSLMNEMAQSGWEFQRAETLPSEERSGLAQTITQWRSVLIFRKPLAQETTTETVTPPALLAAPAPETIPEPETDEQGVKAVPDDAAAQTMQETAEPEAVHPAAPMAEPLKPIEEVMRLRAERHKDP